MQGGTGMQKRGDKHGVPVLQTAKPPKKGWAMTLGSLQEWVCLSISAILPLSGHLPGRSPLHKWHGSKALLLVNDHPCS